MVTINLKVVVDIDASWSIVNQQLECINTCEMRTYVV
jgi:hypothetical protein